MGVTIVQSHPSKRAEPSLIVPILMALKLPQMLLEDIVVTQLGPYSGGCPSVSEDLGVWDVMINMWVSQGRVLTLCTAHVASAWWWLQPWEWSSRNKHPIPMLFVLISLHANSFLPVRHSGPIPQSSHACAHPTPLLPLFPCHPQSNVRLQGQGHQPGPLSFFFPIAN